MKKYNIILFIAWVLLMIVIACSEEEEKSLFYTAEEQTLLNYMINSGEEYTAFLSLLEKTGYRGAFGAYGNYTLFAFTNEAWNAWLEKKGKKSVDEFEPDYLKRLVRYHTVNTGKLLSGTFKFGNLDRLNMDKANLVSSFGNGNQIFINGYAEVVKRDIELLNGVLFQLDAVLDPVDETIAGVISENTGCSLFVKALQATGLMEQLKQTEDAQGYPLNYTVMMTPDSVYKRHGIETYEQLLAHWGTENPMNRSGSFFQYMARHILKDAVFQNRFTTGLYETFGEQYLDVVVDSKFIINPASNEGNTSIILTAGNRYGVNGVYHVLTDWLDLVPVERKTLYWEFSEQPELTDWKLSNAGAWNDLSKEQYAIEGTYAAIETNCSQFFYYHSPGGNYDDLYNQDGMLAKQGNWYMNYRLPAMPKGKYSLWVHVLKGNSSAAVVQCYWDGLKTGRVFGLGPDGKKRFVGGVEMDRWGPKGGNFTFKQAIPGKYNVLAMYLGEVNITGQHIFGMKTVLDGLALIDRLEFIPVIEEETIE